MFTKGELDWYRAGCLVRQPRLEPGFPELSSVDHAMASPPTANAEWILDANYGGRILDGGGP